MLSIWMNLSQSKFAPIQLPLANKYKLLLFTKHQLASNNTNSEIQSLASTKSMWDKYETKILNSLAWH